MICEFFIALLVACSLSNNTTEQTQQHINPKFDKWLTPLLAVLAIGGVTVIAAAVVNGWGCFV